jgi:hypothetical protein
MSLAGRECSPGEDIALHACAEFIPVGRDRLAKIEGGATAVDLDCPGLIHGIFLGVIETLEKTGGDLCTIMFRQAQCLLQQIVR